MVRLFVVNCMNRNVKTTLFIRMFSLDLPLRTPHPHNISQSYIINVYTRMRDQTIRTKSLRIVSRLFAKRFKVTKARALPFMRFGNGNATSHVYEQFAKLHSIR